MHIGRAVAAETFNYQFESLSKSHHQTFGLLGSGRGSDIRGPWFESSHRQTFI